MKDISVSIINLLDGNNLQEVNLLEVLSPSFLENEELLTKYKKTRKKISKIRIARRLPLFSPTGVYQKREDLQPIIPSNFLGLELDFSLGGKRKYHSSAKKDFCINNPWVAYCGKSTYPNKHIILIKIANPSDISFHYNAIRNILRHYGIRLKETYNQLPRFLHLPYSKRPYINLNVISFEEKFIYEPCLKVY